MGQETVTYLSNIVIVTILACLLTHYWLRQGRTAAMGFWMISAWIMAVADCLFAARPGLTPWIGRIVPTLLVTVGHAGLLLGARKTAALRSRLAVISIVIIMHGAGLLYFFLGDQHSIWRMVANGIVWAALSLASYLALRKAPRVFWYALVAPANAFLLHGAFHCLRIGVATLCAFNKDWTEVSGWLQGISDFEVSFFMVALFVGLLVSNLQMRNQELSNALAEVQTLTGLLPICAWCKKVRNDNGYWQRVEDYLASRSQLKFTHGICTDCYNEQRPKKMECTRD
jgi:hypothetical protein